MKSKKGTPPVPPVEVTAEERYHLINDAAYFRAPGRRKPLPGGSDEQAEPWCDVESEIDTILEQHHVKVPPHD